MFKKKGITLLVGILFLISFTSAFNFGETSTSPTTNNIYVYNGTDLNHNNMSGLQGGVADEYYHIRQSWYNELASDIFNWITQTEGDARYLQTETDPLWTTNFTLYNSSWSAAGSAETDPYWTSNFTAYNDSWSSITNTSYYLTTNPFSFYNSTDFNYNDYLLSSNWNATNESYYLATNPFSFYNSTDFSINDYALLSTLNNGTYNYDWNSTGLIINWSVDLSNYLTLAEVLAFNYYRIIIQKQILILLITTIQLTLVFQITILNLIHSIFIIQLIHKQKPILFGHQTKQIIQQQQI